MNFQLTKEQEFVRKMVREFATNEVEPLAADIDKEHRFPVETVEKMAKYGMLGVPFPTEYGGAGGDHISYAITVEELSRVCASTGVICSAHTSLCCWPIFNWGNEEQKKKYLPDLLSGKKLGAFGLTEPNAGTDASGQQTRAELVGDKWILNGAKVFISNHGISAFIVEKNDPGFSIGKTEDKMGICASSTTELIFQNCEIPADRLLGQVGDGFKVAMSTLDGGRIGIASQALGIAQGAFDVTVEYMNARKQFGKKLSQMQALQFAMADLKTKIEASRLLIYKAADMKDKHMNYGEAAAMAKLFAAETAMEVTTKCVQYHGGYGYTKDYPVERMMRDAKITEIYEGTSEVQRMVIAGKTFKK